MFHDGTTGKYCPPEKIAHYSVPEGALLIEVATASVPERFVAITDRQLTIWRVIRGQRLKAVRDHRGYKQGEMAALIGLRYGRTDYNKWEAGSKPMNADVAYRLSVVLAMTANFLLAGEVDDRMVELTDPAFCADLLERRQELGLVDLRSDRRRGCRRS